MSSQPSDDAIRAATVLACAPAEESSSEDDQLLSKTLTEQYRKDR